jgi:hypothetical protein
MTFIESSLYYSSVGTSRVAGAVESDKDVSKSRRPPPEILRKSHAHEPSKGRVSRQQVIRDALEDTDDSGTEEIDSRSETEAGEASDKEVDEQP